MIIESCGGGGGGGGGHKIDKQAEGNENERNRFSA